MSNFPFTVPLSPREVISTTTNQRAPLGTRGATADGRIYRYAKAGAAIEIAHTVNSPITTTAWGNATGAALSTESISPTDGATAVPITARTLRLTSTYGATKTLTADLYKDGWLWVSGTATQHGGQVLKIKSHEAGVSGSTGLGATGGKFEVVFEDGYYLSKALDTDCWISMSKSEYDGVIVTAISNVMDILGVPNCDVASDSYFWLQTWGICSIKSEAEAITSGKNILNSTQTAGCIQGVTGSTDYTGTGQVMGGHIIGTVAQSTALTVLLASNCILVNLTISP